MQTKHVPYGPYERWFKRPIDIFCALAAMLVFWWLYVIVAVLVRVKLGSPVIFCQERPGRGERIFKLYKFRTMTEQRDADGNLLPDEVRLTRFGRFLRSTSLDELPEAWNILKGDMSVVGPRPLLVEYLPRYSSTQRRRHEVRPGLTGYAQVHGRNAVSWEERFALDVAYLERITWLGDLRIVWDTIGAVIRRQGISGENTATMVPFSGTREEAEVGNS